MTNGLVAAMGRVRLVSALDICYAHEAGPFGVANRR
jgi:hypothetical protein